jgi:leader peptidase (prepilin peptidase) / N-methyltransferase
MPVLEYIIVILFGACIGSFLNVCIDRLPLDKSLLRPGSHCDGCGRKLKAWENIPVISYLVLGGKCRSCGARIPWRVLLVEVLTALIFALAWQKFGLTPPFFVTAFWSCIFLIVIFIDKEHQLILNKVTYPSIAIALALLIVEWIAPQAGLLSHLIVLNNTEMIPVNPLVSGLLAGGIFFVFFIIVYLINPGGLGIGDIKLVGLIGLATGFPLGFVAMFIGIIIGGIAAVVMLILRKKGRKDIMPYGVFLGIGPIAALLWGADIFAWYLG